MINRQWLELSISLTNFHCPKNVRATVVLLDPNLVLTSNSDTAPNYNFVFSPHRCPLPHQVSSTSSGVLYLTRRPLPHQVSSTSSGVLYLIRRPLPHQVSSTSSGALYLIRCPLPHQVSSTSSGHRHNGEIPDTFRSTCSVQPVDFRDAYRCFSDMRIDLMAVNGQYQGSARTSTQTKFSSLMTSQKMLRLN